MPRCSIGLGGNLGDVSTAFATALKQLDQAGASVDSVSRLYVTRAVGPHAGGDFHNACALLDTELAPHDLLDLVQEVENDAGRTRLVRWGARPLDIDLLTWGDMVLHDPRLTLPHPGIAYRRFVLDPLSEIAPQWIHPVLRRSVTELQQRLRDRPLRIVLWGGRSQQPPISARLIDCFAGSIRIGMALPLSLDETVIDLDPARSVTPPPPPQAFVVQLDPQLAAEDIAAATVAVVSAMLDEPAAAGEIRLPDR